jgi:hypothetical protein
VNTKVTVRSSPPPVRSGGRFALERLWKRGFSEDVPTWVRFAGTAAIVAGAALMVATAVIHLHLWLIGYRHVPRLGPLFMAQAVTGLVAAPVVALGRQAVVVLGAAAYMAASAGGLVLSATIGFVGIHDGLGVPWAGTSLAVELAGVVLLGSAGVLQLVRRR